MRRTGPLALLAATALTLSGCVSEPEPGAPMPTSRLPAPTSPTPSDDATTPEASSAPTETAPTLPVEATTNDAAGAKAFVFFWYSLFNYAVETGDTAPVLANSSPDCDICSTLVSDIEDGYSGGGTMTGGQVEVLEVIAPSPDDTGAILLSVVIDQEDSEYLTRDGSTIDTFSGSERLSQGVVLQRVMDDARWQMFGIGT